MKKSIKRGIQNETNFRKHPIVIIHWVDSAGISGWKNGAWMEEHSSPEQCMSAGILLKDCKEYVTLVQSVGEGGNVMDSVSIPWVNVTKWKIVAKKLV
jgi:hypothetical protein